MNQYKSACVLSALALSLSACGGGGGGDGSSFRNCVSISGGSTTVTTATDVGCTGCSSVDNNQAIDGNFGTAASLDTTAGAAGALTLRATAQDGVIFPGGNTAGVVISAGVLDGNVGIRTFSDGSLVEDRSSNSVTITSSGLTLVHFQTTSAFDAVEFEVRGASTTAQNVSLFEFCSNADGFSGF